MTEEQLRKAWANVESLAYTSDYCNHDKDSRDLKDIKLIAKLVHEEIKVIRKLLNPTLALYKQKEDDE